MKSFLLALALLFATGSVRASDDHPAAAVRAADDERVASMIAADPARLGAVLSDDLRYAHSSGTVDTKAALLEALAAQKLQYRSIDYLERSFTFPAPGIALMAGRSNVMVRSGGTDTELHLSFLAVWREEAGKWRFLAWQSAKLPAPAGK